MTCAVRGRSLTTTQPKPDRIRAPHRARVVLAAAAGASLFCGSTAFADNYTWIAPAGTQVFQTPGNWLPSGPPGSGDIAVFDLNQLNTVQFTSDASNIALEVLQGTLTFGPDPGATPVQRTHSLLIDSFIRGGSLTLAGDVPTQREIRMDVAENLFVGGDSFSAGPASGLTLAAGASMNVGLSLKLWNGSTLTISGGAMSVATFDHSSGGIFNFTGGRLHAGTFQGNLTNSGGTISPGTSAGVTRITGNLQMDSGAIEIELGGFTPGTDNDLLEVAGSASFGTSSIVIKSLNGFLPLPGDVFEVVTYASGTGDPTIANETGYAGLTFDPTLTPTSLAIRAQALFAGDADLNGLVDLRDLYALSLNWLSNANWLGGDFDGNGFVDKADLTLLAQNWQAGVAGAPFGDAADGLGLPQVSLPEPIFGGVLPLWTAQLLRRRRGLR